MKIIKHTTIRIKLKLLKQIQKLQIIRQKLYINSKYHRSNTQQNLNQEIQFCNTCKVCKICRNTSTCTTLKLLQIYTLHTMLWYTYYTHALNTKYITLLQISRSYNKFHSVYKLISIIEWRWVLIYLNSFRDFSTDIVLLLV